MKQAWRWFGPDAGISLDAVRQAGATDIVSALHHIPIGTAWSYEEVSKRKSFIEDSPTSRIRLKWSVVESIPIPDAVKLRGAAAKAEIDTWIASMKAVADNDIFVVCYNFMPVVDWTRTDTDFAMPSGATAMRFDVERYAAFDLHILKRENAEDDYDAAMIKRANRMFETMSDVERERVTNTIVAALPGAATQSLTLSEFRNKLNEYMGLSAEKLRQNLIEFLEIVTPAAEAMGVRLALHPDDPPRSLFGLPRVVSTADDYQALFDAVPSPANGICFCTGSLGARQDNDLVAMSEHFVDRIGFAHLRAVKHEVIPGSFHEASLLEGDADMVGVVRNLLAGEARRAPEDEIIFRPDHGHRMLGDLHEDTGPGYPAVGRLRSLAELRGIIAGLTGRLN